MYAFNQLLYLLIIIIIILRHKDIMFLKQSCKGLADLCPNVEEGNDNRKYPEKTKGHLQR